jgi:tetratricopeptide (TPR) repeat protein
MRLCLVIAGLVSPMIFVPTHAGAEDRDCRRYVPEIGITIRVPCDDTPAPPAVVTPSPAESADKDRCLNEKNPSTAIGICKVFIANSPGLSRSTLASVYNKLALASLRLKDNQSVLLWTKKSLDITPNAVEYYLAGQAYAALNDPTHAVQEFNKALIVAPKYLLALHRRGEAYLQLGEIEQAKSDFEAALSLHANFKPSIDALRRLKQRG